MTPDAARPIAELLVTVWPKPEKTVDVRVQELTTGWSDYSGSEAQAPRSFIIRDAGQVIAHAMIFPRTVGTSDGDLAVLALAKVCVLPNRRGEHLGERVVRAAFDLVDGGVFPFSLFQTSTKVRPFYERLDCATVSNPIVNSLGDQPNTSPFWDEVVMRYPDGPGWPAGDVDLRGPGY